MQRPAGTSRDAAELAVVTEWGVADERGEVTPCGSEQAARQLAAETGGQSAYRRTWTTGSA
jgi:hypothetical protein